VFVPGKHFQQSLLYASKDRDYLSGAPERNSRLGQAFGLIYKHKNRLERFAMDEYSITLQILVNCGRKMFYNIGPRAQIIRILWMYFVNVRNKFGCLSLASISSLVKCLLVR
jgi:hypothetical protein